MKILNKFFLLVLIGLSINFTTEAQTTYWTNAGNYDTSWYDGSQTTFNLGTAAQLAGLAYLVNNGKNMLGKTINLTSDINLGAHEWVPIGNTDTTYFRGVFNGGEHIISNLSIYHQNFTYNAYGLFGSVDQGTIENITLDTSCIIDRSAASAPNNYTTGGIVGRADASSLVRNCHNAGTISGNIIQVGGIVGEGSTSTIDGCSFSGTINNGIEVGGICGHNGSVMNCYNTGSIHGSANVGGITSNMDSYSPVVLNCYNTGEVSAADNNTITGGIIGCIYSTETELYQVRNCYNAGVVSNSGNNKGGVLGKYTGTIAYLLCSSYRLPLENGNSYGIEKTETEMKAAAFTQLLNDSVTAYNTAHPTEIQWKTWYQGTDNYPCFVNTTSIEENNIPVISVYPNPANNILYINGISDNTAVMVYDILGKMVMKATLGEGAGLNVETLNSGLYFIKAEGIVTKFIKE